MVNYSELRESLRIILAEFLSFFSSFVLCSLSQFIEICVGFLIHDSSASDCWGRAHEKKRNAMKFFIIPHTHSFHFFSFWIEGYSFSSSWYILSDAFPSFTPLDPFRMYQQKGAQCINVQKINGTLQNCNVFRQLFPLERKKERNLMKGINFHSGHRTEPLRQLLYNSRVAQVSPCAVESIAQIEEFLIKRLIL